jgi:hypothetical protein
MIAIRQWLMGHALDVTLCGLVCFFLWRQHQIVINLNVCPSVAEMPFTAYPFQL